MKPTQNGGISNPSSRLAERPRYVFLFNEIIRDLLYNTLMWFGVIEVIDVLLHNAMGLMAMQNEYVVQVFSIQTTTEALSK